MQLPAAMQLSWQRATVDTCHPRTECRVRNFGKENRQILLQKSSEILIRESKWVSATSGLSESSLSDLGGKVLKASLTTFQTVVKKPDLANLLLVCVLTFISLILP